MKVDSDRSVKTSTIKSGWILFLTAVLACGFSSIAHACPGCSEALPGHVSEGYNTSILFLIATPFIIAGSVAVGIFFISRAKGARVDSEVPNKSIDEKTGE